MSKGLHPSTIDYIAQAKERINRPGYVLNIITGCEHWHMPEICACGTDCYAYRMVLHGRLKDNKAYPYGFTPTLHPERIQRIPGPPRGTRKLIFCNDMGDVGGDWLWNIYGGYSDTEHSVKTSVEVALEMRNFALLNPSHILLLLTKNPSWYRYAEWPDNVWCGFSATNNEELANRWGETLAAGVPHWWASLEPWLSDEPPYPHELAPDSWLVIGGLSGKDGHGVSHATHKWLRDKDVQATRFAKDNCRPSIFSFSAPREYPDEWKIKQEDE